MPRAYEEKGAYESQNEEKKGPTKTKNEGNEAYKGQNEGNRTSKIFGSAKNFKSGLGLGPTRALIRAWFQWFPTLKYDVH